MMPLSASARSTGTATNVTSARPSPNATRFETAGARVDLTIAIVDSSSRMSLGTLSSSTRTGVSPWMSMKPMAIHPGPCVVSRSKWAWACSTAAPRSKSELSASERRIRIVPSSSVSSARRSAPTRSRNCCPEASRLSCQSWNVVMPAKMATGATAASTRTASCKRILIVRAAPSNCRRRVERTTLARRSEHRVDQRVDAKCAAGAGLRLVAALRGIEEVDPHTAMRLVAERHRIRSAPAARRPALDLHRRHPVTVDDQPLAFELRAPFRAGDLDPLRIARIRSRRRIDDADGAIRIFDGRAGDILGVDRAQRTRADQCGNALHRTDQVEQQVERMDCLGEQHAARIALEHAAAGLGEVFERAPPADRRRHRDEVAKRIAAELFAQRDRSRTETMLEHDPERAAARLDVVHEPTGACVIDVDRLLEQDVLAI